MASDDATHRPYQDHVGIDAIRKRRDRLKQRARAEYLASAEEDWRLLTGRPMTTEELEGALRRYPGDLP
jgi:hypothetical protein